MRFIGMEFIDDSDLYGWLQEVENEAQETFVDLPLRLVCGLLSRFRGKRADHKEL